MIIEIYPDNIYLQTKDYESGRLQVITRPIETKKIIANYIGEIKTRHVILYRRVKSKNKFINDYGLKEEAIVYDILCRKLYTGNYKSMLNKFKELVFEHRNYCWHKFMEVK